MSSPKIFCISFQRTGTTSVGQFFKEHDFRVCTWDISHKNKWSTSWLKGDYESIFNSKDFIVNQVFEDNPWWCNDFYKVLFHRFPKAKFVMLERNSDKWFDSMVSHSGGKTLGNTHRHAVVYNRLKDFNEANFEEENRYTSKLDNLLEIDEKYREHYTTQYEIRNSELKDFFNRFGPDRIITTQLEDPLKWQKIGAFFDVKVEADYEMHTNKSN